MNDSGSEPQHPLLKEIHSHPGSQRRDTINQIMAEFMDHYGYSKIDQPPLPTKIQPKPVCKRYEVTGVLPDGKFLLQLVPVKAEEKTEPEPDQLYNYGTNLCHWVLHLTEMSDTTKEGDLTRLGLNCRYNIPFFFSHSSLSKYMVENIDFILKTDHLLSPLQRIRVLEGSYVNVRGGKGMNVESDLVQEHSVRNQKSLIKSLGANKSNKAILRATGAADTIVEICSRLDKSLGLQPKSSRHAKAICEKDIETIRTTLRKLRPFKYTPGRKCEGFDRIQAKPLSPHDIPAMKVRIDKIINRLTRGRNVPVEELEDDSEPDDATEDEATHLPHI